MSASRSSILLAVLVLGPAGCVGPKLLGEVEGTQTKLQRAIRDGSKAINCAPKETAIAEANIKFAEDALAVGEYYRGKQAAESAEYHTDKAQKLTDTGRCKPVARVGDRDGDGYDDAADGCPDDPEDFDSFEDDDGCPDKDNDGDGVLDASEFKDGEWVNLDQKDGKDCRNDKEDVDNFEDEDGCPDPDNDNDGILDEPDKCPVDPEDIDNFEDEDGCPDADNDVDKICDPWVEGSSGAEKYADICKGKDQCPDKPEDYDGDRDDDGCPDLKAEFDGCSVNITEKVFFKFNKSEIDPKSFELLNDVATVILEVPEELNFRVEGHTDSKGGNKYNKKLSQRRSDAVAAYLRTRGVPGTRLLPTGFGEERPIDSNRSSDGRARNRRVEFNVSNAKCEK